MYFLQLELQNLSASTPSSIFTHREHHPFVMTFQFQSSLPGPVMITDQRGNVNNAFDQGKRSLQSSPILREIRRTDRSEQDRVQQILGVESTIKSKLGLIFQRRNVRNVFQTSTGPV